MCKQSAVKRRLVNAQLVKCVFVKGVCACMCECVSGKVCVIIKVPLGSGVVISKFPMCE